MSSIEELSDAQLTTINASAFHYEGSIFLVVRNGAITHVSYIIDEGTKFQYMGEFKSIGYGSHFKRRVTKFIDDNIEVLMKKQEAKLEQDAKDLKEAFKREREEM